MAVRRLWRLRGIIAAAPFRIVADRVDNHPAPGAVAPGNLRRQTGQRQERIHEIRMRFTPKPRVHSAHRCPHHEPRMVHSQAVGQQSKLRLDHVDVAVTRKLRVHSVARLARFPVPDSVREHDEKFRGIKRLTRAKKFAREFRPDELRAAAGRPMRDQHRVAHGALLILHRFANGPVMDLQFRQRLARSELEIADDVIAFRRRRIIGREMPRWHGTTSNARARRSNHRNHNRKYYAHLTADDADFTDKRRVISKSCFSFAASAIQETLVLPSVSSAQSAVNFCPNYQSTVALPAGSRVTLRPSKRMKRKFACVVSLDLAVNDDLSRGLEVGRNGFERGQVLLRHHHAKKRELVLLSPGR